MPTRRKQRLLTLEAISDRQPTDRLERRDGRLYLVDTNGYFAPVEVQDQETEGWPTFKENGVKTTRAEDINRAWLAVLRDPWMTAEAKEARVRALRARWHELFGDAMFVVDN